MMYKKRFQVFLAIISMFSVNFVFAQEINPLLILREQTVKSQKLTVNPLKMEQSDSIKSLTDIKYFFGSQESQYLNFRHSQSFSKKASINILYSSSSGEGNLVEDEFKYSNLILSGNYEGDKFILRSRLKFEQETRQENGGLLTDSLFVQSDLAQKFIEVNLKSNNSDRKRLVVRDTLEYKISNNAKINAFINFNHFDRNYKGFGVSDSSFYQDILIDSVGRVDYYRNRNLDYGLGFNLSKGRRDFSMGSFLISDFYFNGSKVDTFGVGLYAAGVVYDSNYTIGLNLKYYLSGFRQNGFEVGLNYSSNLESGLIIGAILSSNLLPVSYDRMRFSGNYYNWDFDSSNYEFSNNLHFGISDSAGSWGLACHVSYSQNYFYFDSMMNPTQVNRAGLLRLNFQKRFKLKKFKFPLSIVSYPLISYEIRNPLVSISAGVLYSFEAFKSNLKVETGILANWFSAYNAKAYEPSTGRFYLQDEQKIGNYPYLDFILKTSIKDASFFIIVTHLNQDLTGRNYFHMPRYLELQRRFVFGLNWRFVN